MLTQEQLDKINDKVWINEETRYPDAHITLEDLADILGLNLEISGTGYYKNVADTLSFLPSENSEKKT